METPGALHRYHEKKAALEQAAVKDWLQRELTDIGFCDVTIEEQPQQLLYIEATFSAKYYEEQVSGLLDALSNWTVEGEFSFQGEDDQLWQLYFTGAEWAERSGTVSYADLETASEQHEGQYPALVEDVGTFEALLSEVEVRLKSDDRPAPQRGRQLMMAFQNQDPDGVLLALTGWSLRSLGALAGIWQNPES